MITIPIKFLRALLLHAVVFTIFVASTSVLANLETEEDTDTNTTSRSHHLKTAQPFVPNNQRDTGFYLYVVSGLALALLNILSCAYIFVRTYTKWMARSYESLPMTVRLPFYTSISDFVIGVFICINVGYTAIYTHPWPQPGCTVIGFFGNLLNLLNRFLFVTITVTTYFRVCRRTTVEFGRFDWRLITFIVIISVVLSVALFPGGNYGTQRYSCFIASRNSWVFYALVVHMGAEIVVALFCYLSIISTLSQNGKIMSRGRFTRRDNTIEVNVTKKILSYVLVYLIQWIPTLVFVTAHLAGAVNEVWAYIFAIIGTNAGGIGTAINYIYNEGWVYTRSSSADASIGSSSLDLKSQSESFPNSGFPRQSGMTSGHPSLMLSNGIIVTNEWEVREHYVNGENWESNNNNGNIIKNV